MPYFDRFDICEAWFLYLAEWHGGQGSPEYHAMATFHRIRFGPATGLDRRSLSENGRDILASLIRRSRRKDWPTRRTR